MAYKIFNQNPWQELVEMPDGHFISIPSSGFSLTSKEPKSLPEGLMIIAVPDDEKIVNPVKQNNSGKGASVDVTVSAS